MFDNLRFQNHPQVCIRYRLLIDQPQGFECPRCRGVMELRMSQVFGVMATEVVVLDD
jgi:hypothetical protein